MAAPRTRFLLALLAGVTFGAEAHAAERPEKREVPDYDGRGGPPTTPGRAALWAPRVALFPLYVVSEYVIRRPLGFVMSAAERAQLPALLYDFFAFGPDHKAGFFPTAFIDFGFEPSVGLYLFWDDAGFDGHALRLHASTWGKDWLAGSFTERFRLSNQHSLTLKVSAVRRPDYAFYGVGPDTPESNLARYGAESFEARATDDVKFLGTSSLRTVIGYRGFSFHPGDYLNQATLEERSAEGTFPLPDGYVDGYKVVFTRGKLALDSRGSLELSKTGVRLELDSEQGTGVGSSEPAGFVRFGGAVGGFLDLADSGRVLSLSAATVMAEPLGGRAVPFTELPTLGGPGLMPGFRAGRLRGESAAVATLRYSWPVWMWLNGSLQGAVGNVFGEKLDGFAAERMRFSGAVGLESVGSEDSTLEIVFGFGTDTFEQGAKVDSLRLSIGARGGL